MSPTCGQVLPILQKLEKHFTVEEGDTVFVCNLKQAVWGNLSKRYQSDGIRHFLEEATALDPRFKHKVEDSTVWDRVKEKLMAGKLTESEQPTEYAHGEDGVTMQSEEKRQQRENEEGEGTQESEEEEEQPPPCKKAIMSPLEELFAAEDDLKMKTSSSNSTTSIQHQTDRELKMYQEMPPTMTSDDPAAWWWNNRTTYPLLLEVAFSYLCVQASSTPSERVFSTAGDTICPERSCTLPEKADMLIFLNKNC
ncbi:hypothetical protein SKAU_G00089900 [Synaphobranchus kaupii]|uniref:HAT C-terminal dimerisation domain-containing protein n=1 Tax=Synaphobranchus kaupii TaxID=118154 RepID=A0A9Q1FWY7_SYNKA|nr:hypothetical protein SKAU_G00089900 [Synaphobranchus kaupii]